MVHNLVFRWPKPLFFMVLGAHGSQMSLNYLVKLVKQEWGSTCTIRALNMFGHASLGG